MLPERCCHDVCSIRANANGSIAAARGIQPSILKVLYRLNNFNGVEIRERMERKLHLPSYSNKISTVIP